MTDPLTTGKLSLDPPTSTTPDNTLEVWTIYDRPDDYPQHHVVRVFRVGPKGALTTELEPAAVVDTLAEARAAIPAGKHRIVRDATDPYAVVESWI